MQVQPKGDARGDPTGASSPFYDRLWVIWALNSAFNEEDPADEPAQKRARTAQKRARTGKQEVNKRKLPPDVLKLIIDTTGWVHVPTLCSCERHSKWLI